MATSAVDETYRTTAGTPPNDKEVEGVKLLPETLISTPPLLGPRTGLKLRTDGSGSQRPEISLHCRLAEQTAAFVTQLSALSML